MSTYLPLFTNNVFICVCNTTSTLYLYVSLTITNTYYTNITNTYVYDDDILFNKRSEYEQKR